METSKALELGKTWLQRQAVPGPQGSAVWLTRFSAATANGIDDSLYYGTPGIAMSLAAVSAVLDDPACMSLALSASDGVVARMSSALEKGADMATLGLYFGWGGAISALRATAVIANNPKLHESLDTLVRDFASAVRRSVQDHRSLPRPLDVTHGAAGVGLALLGMYDRSGDSELLVAAQDVGDYILDYALPRASGHCWPSGSGATSGSPLYPNFSHGTAGVAFFLARLSRRLSDEEYLRRALSGAEWLITTLDDDSLAYHHEPGGEHLRYLGWCHGPVGACVLYRELAIATGASRWERYIERATAILERTIRSGADHEGLWNNFGVCCGIAGLGLHFLRCNEATRLARHLEHANLCAQSILAGADKGQNGVSWSHAEHRTRPADIEAKPGYSQGSAGILLFLARLLKPESVAVSAAILPDDGDWSHAASAKPAVDALRSNG